MNASRPNVYKWGALTGTSSGLRYRYVYVLQDMRWSVGVMNGDANGFMRQAKVPYRVLYALLFTLLVVFVVMLLPSGLSFARNEVGGSGGAVVFEEDLIWYAYNATYPPTTPTVSSKGTEYRIGLVADLDENSKVDDKSWKSYFRTGTVTLHHDSSLSVRWDDTTTTLSAHLSEKGRGVELSELIVFNGRLYTVDDRTGIIFQLIHGNRLVPWVILEDGPGDVNKGFKAEWMAVKDHLLYVGGLGKEWTTVDGEYVNDHPQYVKIINPLGHVHHRPWASIYKRMKQSAGIHSPGYIIHEAACWSDVHRKWFFLPRRASHKMYNDVDDEHRATNLLISSDEGFTDVQTQHFGPLNQFHGFSTFKFVPGTRDSIILALKSEENKGKIATYMMAFNLQGEVVMEEEKIADHKFEGLEFI